MDVQRARSMLAQLDRGIVEQVVQRRSSNLTGDISAKIFGAGVSGAIERQGSSEEQRSLQDLTYIVFEEIADGQHLIADLGPEFGTARAWESGEVHDLLRPGQLIRVTGDIQVLDADLMAVRLRRLSKVMDIIAKTTVTTTTQRPAKTTPPRGPRTTPGKTMADAADLLEQILAGLVVVRALPVSVASVDCGFAGVLLGRDEYLQREREALFSRFGLRLGGWTMVASVASIPRKKAPAPIAAFDFTRSEGGLSRARLEKGLVDMMDWLETMGFYEGPTWPTITVTPLALYRELPTG